MSAEKRLVVRLWILLVLLTAGFSSIWLLPEQGEMKPSQLATELPEVLDGWSSQRRMVSPVERKVLADDTEFARRVYKPDAEPGFSGVEMSVVFSGKDINNSLHRPEVCLRAQGWNFERERSIVVKGVMPDGSDLPVREIVCVRPRVKVDGVEPPMNKFGEPLYDKLIQYYTFFGSDSVVSGHYERTFEDIKGRVFGGYDQQWAYATFAVTVSSVYVDQGFNLGVGEVFDEQQSVAILENLIQKMLPQVIEAKK